MADPEQLFQILSRVPSAQLFWISPHDLRGWFAFSYLKSFALLPLAYMAPNLYVERDFSVLLNESGGYGHIFVDRIRAWNWYSLVYDNNEHDAYYCPDLVTTFYNSIDQASVNHDTYQFVSHMPFGDIFVTIPLIAEITHVPNHPHHSDPLPLLDYLTIMGVRCTIQDRGLKANTTFRNVHCIGRWVQRNIFGLDHQSSFNRPVLQIIHDLMTQNHTVCLNRAIFRTILENSSRTRGAKHSHSILITRLCKYFMSDAVFNTFDRVPITVERPTSSYNGCLQALWTPSAQPETVPVESSSEESLERIDEPHFWRQDPPTEPRAFMSTIWKGMKKIFRGQVRLRKKVEEQSSRLDGMEAALRRSQSAGPSTTAGPKRQRE